MMQLPEPTRELPVRDSEIFPQPANVVEPVFTESARETIIALGHLAELFERWKRWIRNKECDEKGRFCLCGGISPTAAGHRVAHYLRAAIRELARPSMTIPVYNSSE
jgi:hypothetical protein